MTKTTHIQTTGFFLSKQYTDINFYFNSQLIGIELKTYSGYIFYFKNYSDTKDYYVIPPQIGKCEGPGSLLDVPSEMWLASVNLMNFIVTNNRP